MDAQQIRDRAEQALQAAGFVVAENDAHIAATVPFPGGACLFIQDRAARMYLHPSRKKLPESADIAARALSRAGLRAISVGDDADTAKSQSTIVLSGGTGELHPGQDPSPGPFHEGWHDQYQRMLRSRDRLVTAANGSSVGSDQARDALYHFFQDAFHLKDWLKYDRSLSLSVQERKDLEAYVNSADELVACADLCNGVKHLSLDKPRIDGKQAQFSSQSAVVMPGPFETPFNYSGRPAVSNTGTTADHQWEITFDGQVYDAAGLAHKVVAEWEKYLKDQDLL